MKLSLPCALLVLVWPCLVPQSVAATKKILLIAGKQSHGPGDHEFRAGALLLEKCLDQVPGIEAEVHTGGWPNDVKAFEGAAAVLIYADGGGGHPAIQGERLALIDTLATKGVGIGCAHYGVEVPKGDPGAAMHRWIGGHYEHQYSVNPMWTPEFKSFPQHAVTRGVKPFAVLDEWYFNMRWKNDMQGITPILVAKPSDDVRDGPYVYPPGPYPHIVEAKNREETMMWTYERPGGGRGFGFTGGHKHVNWWNPNFRKVVLNALLWIAHVEVPANGVDTAIAIEDIAKNLDPKNAPANEANVTGTWSFEVETSNGKGTPSFTFAHAGRNLLGRYKGLFGEADVTGETKGKNVQFTFVANVQDEPRTITYQGQIESPNAMKGTVKMGDFDATWTATRTTSSAGQP